MATLVFWILIAPHSPLFPTATALAFTLIPLLLPLRGLLHGRPRSFAWNSFLMLAYFILGVGEFYSAPVFDFYSALTILFSSLCFISSLFYIKFQAKTSVSSQN